MSLGEFERMADLARLRKKSSPTKPGIAPGAPATMLLVEGDYIEAKASDAGAGTVEVRNSAGALIKTISFAPKATFNVGPFRGTNSVSFTCTAGSIDAVVGDAVLGAPSFDDVNALRSPSGKPLPLLAANTFAICGNSRDMMNNAVVNTNTTSNSVAAGILTISANGHQRIPGERINIALINTIGGVAHQEVNKDYTVLDLVDANNFRVDLGDAWLNGAVVGSATGNAFQYMSLRDTAAYGWWTWLQAISGDCVELVENFAIGGVGFNTPGGGILTQVDKAIATGAPNIVVGDPINDIQARILTESEVWANFKAAYNKCRAANRTMWALTCAHLGTAHPTYAVADAGYTNWGHHTNMLAVAYNKRLKNFAKKNTGIVVLYMAEPTTDPASTTGELLSTCTADGIHFQAFGGRKAGGDARNVSAVTSRFARAQQQAYSMIEGRIRQGALDRTINANVLFNDGAETAGLGNQWAESTVNTSATKSTIARTVAADGDTAGKNQVCVITSSGAGNYVLRSSGSANYTVSDILRFVSDLQVTGMSLVTSVNISINVNAKNSLGVDTSYSQLLFATGAGFDNTDLPRLKIRSRDLSFPANYSAHTSPGAGVSIQVVFSGSGGSATLSLGNAPLEKVQYL